MHHHLLAASVWRYRHGDDRAAGLLRRVAEQDLILVTTGGRDFLSSTGEMKRVDGGFLVSARKSFTSGYEAGQLLFSSSRFEDPEEGTQVLHFVIPTSTEGLKPLDDWHALGMRATGSRTLLMEDVLVPDDAVTLRRPAREWHPVMGTVIAVAMPIVMSVYLGVAERAARIARKQARRKPGQEALPYLLGEMANELTTARLALESSLALTDDYAFEPSRELASEVLMRKTIGAKAGLAVGEKALEVAGGVGFFQGFGLERQLRDLHAAQFHPLPEKQQQRFTGRLALGLEPVGD